MTARPPLISTDPTLVRVLSSLPAVTASPPTLAEVYGALAYRDAVAGYEIIAGAEALDPSDRVHAESYASELVTQHRHAAHPQTQPDWLAAVLAPMNAKIDKLLAEVNLLKVDNAAMKADIAAMKADIIPLGEVPEKLDTLTAQFHPVVLLSVKAYNTTIRQGKRTNVRPIPDTMGNVAPPGSLPITDVAQIDSMDFEDLGKRLVFLGEPLPNSTAKRRAALRALHYID